MLFNPDVVVDWGAVRSRCEVGEHDDRFFFLELRHQ